MQKKHYVLLMIVSFSVMLMFGFVDALRGVSLPFIETEFKVNNSTIGMMILVSNVGFLISCSFAGIATRKYGEKLVSILGYIFLLSGMVLIYFSNSMLLIMLSISFIAAGFGIFEITINALAGKIFVKNTAAMMNILHLFYGFGAILGPKYAKEMLALSYLWKEYYIVAAGIVLVFFTYMIFVKFPTKENAHITEEIPLKVLLKNINFWFISLGLGFGVTVELGTGNWFVKYLVAEYAFSIKDAADYLSYFFMCFAAGRVFCGVIAEKIGYAKSLIIFIIGNMTLLIISFLFKESGVLLVSVSGFFIASIFPTTMAIIVREFKDNASAVISGAVMLSSFITMSSNWIIGKVSDLFGVFLGFHTLIAYSLLSTLFYVLYLQNFSSAIPTTTTKISGTNGYKCNIW